MRVAFMWIAYSSKTYDLIGANTFELIILSPMAIPGPANTPPRAGGVSHKIQNEPPVRSTGITSPPLELIPGHFVPTNSSLTVCLRLYRIAIDFHEHTPAHACLGILICTYNFISNR